MATEAKSIRRRGVGTGCGEARCRPYLSGAESRCQLQAAGAEAGIGSTTGKWRVGKGYGSRSTLDSELHRRGICAHAGFTMSQMVVQIGSVVGGWDGIARTDVGCQGRERGRLTALRQLGDRGGGKAQDLRVCDRGSLRG
jgi:hypothetical protein